MTTPTPSAHIDPAWFDHGPINLSAKVGIAVGGFACLLMVAGFFIICNGKRRRKAYLRKLDIKYRKKGWPMTPQTQQQGEMFETPVSQRPLRGWDDSPQSAHTQTNFPTYFSPYSSQFNSPVSPQDGLDMSWPAAALPKPQSQASPQQEIGLAFGNPNNYGPLTTSPYSPENERKYWKQREESYEMHEVDSASSGNSRRQELTQHQQQAPVLNHPGYGRNSASPPRGGDKKDARGGFI